MPLTKWKRPQQLTLWGGYIIPIVYWSARKIKKELEKDPSSPIARSDLYGYWDGVRIVINKDEPIWDQIRTLGHELVHAVHDYAHWLDENFVTAMKAEAGETIVHMAEEDDD